MTYCDTSFLLPLYVREDNWHRKASEYHDKHLQEEPFIFNPWHRVELRHAVRQAVAGRHATKIFRHIQEDLGSGKLWHPTFSWPAIFDRLDELSGEFARQSRAGTVDYWHVAFAVETEADKFITFDREQWKIAREAGLDAPNLLESGPPAKGE